MRSKILAFLAAAATILGMALCSIPDAHAQGKITIQGTVLDELGEPMIGAGVLVKNTVIGVITDLDGHYTITVDAAGGGGILVFSSLGYDDQEIPVNSRTEINVQMQLQTTSLDEVVVVGYGTQKRESVVGSISTVDASNLKVPSAQLSTGLAGQLSGVVAVQRSGKPGGSGEAGESTSEFYIRGVSSFMGGTKPLVLVDGVEREIDLVDTDDIASFSILKDASASAVYGVRGANGVIIITTKKGDVGRPKVNVRSETGLTQPLIMPKFVNSEQLATMYNWAAATPLYTEEDIQKYRDHSDPDLYPDVNWMDQMYRKVAFNQRVNVSVSGGSDVVRYFISGSYFTESSIFKNAGNRYGYDSSISYDKFNFRANVDINLTESTILSLNLANIYETRNSPGTDDGTIWYWAFSTSPNAVPYEYSDGTISRPSGTNENPWNLLVHTGYKEAFTNSAQSVIGITQDFGMLFEPLKGLTANFKFSWDAWNKQNQSRTKTPTQYKATGRDEDGNLIFGSPVVTGSESLSFSAGGASTMTTYLEASLNYSRLFGSHRVGGMLLYNHTIKRWTQGKGSSDLSLPYKNQGLAGRVTYAYKDRYFAEVNVGYNGSENFAPGHRFGFFPALSVGYLISEEDFWAPYKNAVNMLKFKASYGLVGNDNIGNSERWLYLPTIITGNYASIGETGNSSGYGLSIGRPANANFSWEEEAKLNVGVEFELFNQLRIMADYFDSHRTGILLPRAGLPNMTGLTGSKLPYSNVGETRNNGIDISAEWHKQLGEWFLTGRGNFTFNRNNLLYQDEPDWKYNYQNAVGKPYGKGGSQPMGLLAVGLFKDQDDIDNSPKQTFGEVRPGDIKYQDINGDGRIDGEDKIYLGYTTLPEITYGFGLNAEYKGFDIGVFFQGIDHVNFFVSGSSLTSPFGSDALDRSAIQQDVWEKGWDRLTNNGQDLSHASEAVYPRLSIGTSAGSENNKQTSSWWQRDGAYLRLKNFEVGYTLPKKLLARLGFVQSVRFYVSGNNLLTFSSFKLWDPEQGGGQGDTYPNNRIYSIGLNANF